MVKNRIKKANIQGNCLIRIFILAIVLGIFQFGCGAGPVWTRDDPCEVLSGFLLATEVQDAEEMWEYLSAGTRDKLDEKARELNALVADGMPRKGFDMLRAGHVLSTTREYKKIELASQNGQNANVNLVLHDGSIIAIVMHREEKRWVIDLPVNG